MVRACKASVYVGTLARDGALARAGRGARAARRGRARACEEGQHEPCTCSASRPASSRRRPQGARPRGRGSPPAHARDHQLIGAASVTNARPPISWCCLSHERATTNQLVLPQPRDHQSIGAASAPAGSHCRARSEAGNRVTTAVLALRPGRTIASTAPSVTLRLRVANRMIVNESVIAAPACVRACQY